MVDFLCLDFLNSYWRDWRGSGRQEDRLDKAEWMQQFLQQWGLEARFPPDEQTMGALRELRERMQSMVEALVAGRSLDETDVDTLNRALEKVSSYPQLVQSDDGYHLKQVTLTRDWPLVMGQIAASFVDLITQQDVRRLKICDNDACRWVFFDESRNRARRWCDDRMCGNLMKVRRFRARQKTEGTEK